jgi:hypothetical protein
VGDCASGVVFVVAAPVLAQGSEKLVWVNVGRESHAFSVGEVVEEVEVWREGGRVKRG